MLYMYILSHKIIQNIKPTLFKKKLANTHSPHPQFCSYLAGNPFKLSYILKKIYLDLKIMHIYIYSEGWNRRLKG